MENSGTYQRRASNDDDKKVISNHQIPHLDLHPGSGAHTNTVEVLDIQTINKASHPELRQNIELKHEGSNVLG